MLQCIASRIEYMPGLAKCPVFKHMHVWWEVLKCPGHHRISEAIEDHIDFHSLIGFACQFFFKLSTYRVIFPDIGFQIDALLRSINRAEHSIVKVTSIIINLDSILINEYFLRVHMRKASLRSLLPAEK